MFTYEPCGCARDESGEMIRPLCGTRGLHAARWSKALRESTAWRRARVADVIAFAGPDDGLAREAAQYGIVPNVR